MSISWEELADLSLERRALLELLLREEGIELERWVIRPQPRDRSCFPLSLAQERLWFLNRLLPGNPAYNELIALQMDGLLDLEALTRSLHALIQRHEILRTTFHLDGEQTVQCIQSDLALDLTSVNLTGLPPEQRAQAIQDQATAEVQRPFDLERGPLLRIRLLLFDERSRVLLLTMHHIIADGWSMRVLTSELSELYRAFLHGVLPRLPELPIQYADFACWQRTWLQGQALAQQMSFWKQRFAAPPPAADLPSDYPRPEVLSFNGGQLWFRLPAPLTQAIKRLSQSSGATLFVVLMSGFQALLFSYTGQPDLVVGTDVANRNRAELEGLIGFFVNQLVLRTDLSGNPTFAELVERVRAVTVAAYEHQDLPFDRLIDLLNIERSLSRTPLFQAKFVLQNPPLGEIALPGLEVRLIETHRRSVKFDLLLNMWEFDGALHGVLDYSSDLFARSSVERMARRFELLLQIASATPHIRLEALCAQLVEVEQSELLQRHQVRKAANLEKLERMVHRPLS